MKYLLWGIGGCLCIFFAYYLIRFGVSVVIAKKQADRAVPYQKLSEDYAKTMLVLGDSTAVGVGADRPEDTVEGRTSAAINATYVENHAVSGAVVADLPSQIAKAARDHYNLILIHIGANDIINFKDADTTAEKLSPILDTLPSADQVILLIAGDVGGATIFPPVMRGQYTKRTLAFHAAFGALANEKGITFVSLYQPPELDPFRLNPERYLSPDGLHPSSAGYGLWFEEVAKALH